MKKNVIKALAIMGAITGDYLGQNYEMILDQEVSDCLMKMYFVMLTSEGHPDKEHLMKEFLIAYHSLNEKQQEIVKADFIKICDAQDKNEKEKIKRKGEIKYE